MRPTILWCADAMFVGCSRRTSLDRFHGAIHWDVVLSTTPPAKILRDRGRRCDRDQSTDREGSRERQRSRGRETMERTRSDAWRVHGKACTCSTRGWDRRRTQGCDTRRKDGRTSVDLLQDGDTWMAGRNGTRGRSTGTRPRRPRANTTACTNVERTNAKVRFPCTDVKHRSEEDEWNADNQSNEERCRCVLQPSTNGLPPANACLVDTRFHCSRHQSSSSDRSNTFPFLDFFRAISSSSS